MKKKLIAVSLTAMFLFTGCNTEKPVDPGAKDAPKNAVAVEKKQTEAKADKKEAQKEQVGESSITKVMAEKKDYPKLKKLIIDTFDIPESMLDKTGYYYNYVDLNNDGANEIFVVLTGPYTSGTGGYAGMIVFPINGELHVNQKFKSLRTPIIISNTVTKGAKEIIVYRSGGGAEGHYVALTASDGTYSKVSKGKALDSLEGVNGRAIISNDIVKDIDNGNILTLK